MSNVEASKTTFTRVTVQVAVVQIGPQDSQSRHQLTFTEADAKSLMYALADTLGFQVSPL